VVRVRQITFRLGPDEFIGIEFGRVARKAVCLHAGMAAEKDLDVPTPMNPPAVPQQDDLASEMREQLAEERDDLGARDVAHVEIEVQPELDAYIREQRKEKCFILSRGGLEAYLPVGYEDKNLEEVIRLVADADLWDRPCDLDGRPMILVWAGLNAE
jgi:hypothetical protein